MDFMIISRVEEMVISRILNDYRVLKKLKTNSKIIIKCQLMFNYIFSNGTQISRQYERYKVVN
jgi:hypothetical protein